MSPSRKLALSVMSAIAAWAAACSVGGVDLTGRRCPCVAGYVCSVDGLCVTETTRPDAPDGAEGDGGCALASWPTRPTGAPGDSTTFTVAFREVRFQPKDFSVPAYDLDSLCTCPDPTMRCKPRAGKPLCDGPGGVDDSLGGLFTQLGASKLSTALDLSRSIGAGQFGVLLRVSAYNGLANDDNVRVELFFSNGVAGAEVPDASKPIPKFDGTDVYTVAASSLEQSGLIPPYVGRQRDDAAYVRDNVLVARFDVIDEFSGELPITFEDAVLVGRIAPVGAGFALSEGRLGGAVPITAVLTNLSRVRSGSDPLCAGSPAFEVLKQQLCDVADIPERRKLLLVDAPCDAASLWLGFKSVPISIGVAWDRERAPGQCGENYDAGCN